jgi:hypothetical protein
MHAKVTILTTDDHEIERTLADADVGCDHAQRRSQAKGEWGWLIGVSLNPRTTPAQWKARERAGSSHQGGSYDLAARFGIVLMCAWTQLSADSFSGFAVRGSRLSWPALVPVGV